MQTLVNGARTHDQSCYGSKRRVALEASGKGNNNETAGKSGFGPVAVLGFRTGFRGALASLTARQVTPDHARLIAGTGGVVGVWYLFANARGIEVLNAMWPDESQGFMPTVIGEMLQQGLAEKTARRLPAETFLACFRNVQNGQKANQAMERRTMQRMKRILVFASVFTAALTIIARMVWSQNGSGPHAITINPDGSVSIVNAVVPLPTLLSQGARRTCGAHLSQYGGVKEVQPHLRHSRATTTLDVYIQEIPEAVRRAVEDLDAALTTSDRDDDDQNS